MFPEVTSPPPYRLFVDDERESSYLTFLVTQGVSDLDPAGPWVVARSQGEAQQIITERGLPELISFDHDYGSRAAGSGRELAEWLVRQGTEGLLDLSGMKYQVHSRDPIGRVNIRGVLDGAQARPVYVES
ncbi:MAG: cyclic-phosphate processing receiver domain-containing protein [Deinococcus sp.]